MPTRYTPPSASGPARSPRTSNLPPQADSDEFHALELRNFVAGRPPMLDLYHFLDGQFVLYCGAHAVFTEEARVRLIDNRVGLLHIRIRGGQIDAGGTGLADLLSLPDSYLPSTVKATLVYRSAVSSIRDLMSATTAEAMVLGAERVVSTTIAHIMNSPDAMQSLIELMKHDSSLYVHSVNVFAYSTAIAKRASFSRDELLKLGLGALLHDVGMARLPEALLDKPVEPTPAELAAIMKHPEWGVEMLGDEARRRPEMRGVVACHHEAIDGAGYPARLRGDQIPPLARIVAVADVYDELTTDRLARPALSPFEALRAMRNDLASRLDQNYVVGLIQVLARA